MTIKELVEYGASKGITITYGPSLRGGKIVLKRSDGFRHDFEYVGKPIIMDKVIVACDELANYSASEKLRADVD